MRSTHLDVRRIIYFFLIRSKYTIKKAVLNIVLSLKQTSNILNVITLFLLDEIEKIFITLQFSFLKHLPKQVYL